MLLQNPFIERQKIIAEEKNLNNMKSKLNLDLIDSPKWPTKLSENSSLEPHLASTFSGAIPFKDSLLSSNSIATTNQGVSTVYGKDSHSGFMFNASNAKKHALNSPKIFTPAKVEIRQERHKSMPKEMHKKHKHIPGIKLTNRDRGIHYFPISSPIYGICCLREMGLKWVI